MLKEYREKIKGFSDLLQYCFFIEEGVVLLKDNSLMFGVYYRGPDLDSASADEISDLSHQFNSILKQLGNGWMLHADLIRQSACEYPSAQHSHFPDAVSAYIDNKRREYYLNKTTHFESVYALLFTYCPPKEIESYFKNLFINQNKNHVSHQINLEFVLGMKEKIILSLTRIFYVLPMCSEKLLNHLYSTIHGESSFVQLPKNHIFLDSFLGCEEIYTGFHPQIGNKKIGVISIIGFPLESYAGFLKRLELLPIHYRWSNRFIFIDKPQAKKILNSHQRHWYQQRKSLVTLLKEAVFSQSSHQSVNQDAEMMANDVQSALNECESGLVFFGYYSSVILIYQSDVLQLREAMNMVLKELENCSLVGKIETINAMEAYLGSLPGHGYQNLRKPLIHTLNLADIIPLVSVWAGAVQHPCQYYGKNAPPLLYANTAGATPFRFFIHQQDVGHTLIIGDTGSGKSTLVGLMAVQHLRYPKAQVYLFDKGYSSYVLCRAVKGQYYDLASASSSLQLSPLQNLEKPECFSFVLEWLEVLFDCQGIKLSALQRNEIKSSLECLKNNNEKCLTHLQSILQDEMLKNGLEYYTMSGPVGALLDGLEDQFNASHFNVFEMTHLLEKNNNIVTPILFYLFEKIERNLQGQPTLVIIEEGHRFLSGKFGERLDVWLRELRKKNVAVIFITQHLNEIVNSSLKHILINNCKTKIFLPNAHAMDEINAEVYKKIGLTEQQLQIIKSAVPKQDYYYSSSSGHRLINFNLDKASLSVVGIDSEKERKMADQYIEKYGDDWIMFWFKYHGVNEDAERWQHDYSKVELQNEKN